MPTTVKIRRSGTASATPSALEHGEIAINYADGKVFWKDASNVITSFTFQSYALASHTHSISDVTGLQTALDGKAASSHTHAASDITSGTLDIARIANDAVTYAKLQNVSATNRILGRSSAGAGDVEELDAATARTVLSVQPTASPAFTGAATFSNTGDVVPLTVTNAGTANSFVVNDASGDTTPFVVDASGNVGIGTSPTERLHVVRSGTGVLANFSDAATQSMHIGVTASAGVYIDNPNGGYVDVQTSGTSRLQITSSAATFSGQIAGQAGAKLTTSSSTGTVAATPSVVLSNRNSTNATFNAAVIAVDTYRDIANPHYSGAIWFTREPASSNNSSATSIVFGTGIDVTQSALPTTRLTISSTGTATFTGQILADDIDTANSVAYGFDSDPDTGIGRRGANILTAVTGGVERLRVSSSGNVTIGEANSANARLMVAGGSSNISSARATYEGTLQINESSLTTLESTGGIEFKTSVFGSGYGVKILGADDGSLIVGNRANSATWSESFRVNQNREMLIGTTTDNGAYLLQVNSQIYATNATIATSDARFKTHVESLTDATSVIESLRPVAFDFIPQTDRNFAAERQVGLIAQETQAALAGTDYADSVVAQCGDHLGLAYEKLVPVLIKALQESNARIAALEERINA
jgi:hypothetical protein